MENDPLLNNDIKWMMKYFEEKFKTINDIFIINKEQLDKQAVEYERRLADLNHENARLLTQQEKAVSLEKFEGTVSTLYSRIDDIRKDIGALSDFKNSMGGQSQARKDIMDLVKLIIIIAGFFIAYFVIKK